MREEFDDTDRRILALLQEDASLAAADVAEEVGLPQSPRWRRIALTPVKAGTRLPLELVHGRESGG